MAGLPQSHGSLTGMLLALGFQSSSGLQGEPAQLEAPPVHSANCQVSANSEGAKQGMII